MKKKQTKSLLLSVAKIRPLTNDQLATVAGGQTAVVCNPTYPAGNRQ